MDREDEILFRAFGASLIAIVLCAMHGKEYFWVALTAVATGALCVVAWYQIGAIERQQRGWETLRICNLYDLDPTLVKHRKILSDQWNAGLPNQDLFTFEYIGVLNYFDAIAIGINQHFYKESVVRAHLGRIMAEYRETWFSDGIAAKLEFDLQNGWSCWIELVDGWIATTK